MHQIYPKRKDDLKTSIPAGPSTRSKSSPTKKSPPNLATNTGAKAAAKAKTSPPKKSPPKKSPPKKSPQKRSAERKSPSKMSPKKKISPKAAKGCQSRTEYRSNLKNDSGSEETSTSGSEAEQFSQYGIQRRCSTSSMVRV